MSDSYLDAVNSERPIVGFGAGRTFELCHAIMPELVSFLVDNDQDLQGTDVAGLPVLHPQELENTNSFIVVFSAQFWDIAESLERDGREWQRDFIQFTEIPRLKGVLAHIPNDVAFQSLSQVISDGDICFDVGTNDGLYALQMGLLVGSGHVHGFEPFPQTFRQAKRNLSHFDLPVTLHNLALGNEKTGQTARMTLPVKGEVAKGGSAHFDFITTSPSDYIDSAEQKKGAQSAWRPEDFSIGLAADVRVVSLDSFISQMGIPDPNLVKLDVEGAEEMVIEGAYGVLRRSMPSLLIEVAGNSERFQAIKDSLSPLGYFPVPGSLQTSDSFNVSPNVFFFSNHALPRQQLGKTLVRR